MLNCLMGTGVVVVGSKCVMYLCADHSNPSGYDTIRYSFCLDMWDDHMVLLTAGIFGLLR